MCISYSYNSRLSNSDEHFFLDYHKIIAIHSSFSLVPRPSSPSILLTINLEEERKNKREGEEGLVHLTTRDE